MGVISVDSETSMDMIVGHRNLMQAMYTGHYTSVMYPWDRLHQTVGTAVVQMPSPVVPRIVVNKQIFASKQLCLFMSTKV